MKRITLRQMKDNQSGTIAAVNANNELGRRIRDMGLVPGTEIKIQGRAPLYDPVAIRLQGFTLMLRNSEADFIEVEVNNDMTDNEFSRTGKHARHRNRGGI
jgi:ferrous iron transport protein A